VLPYREMPVISSAFEIAPNATVAILVAALFGLGVAAERAFIVARSRLSGNGRPFIERLVAMVQAGQIDEALAACSSTRAILPDIGLIVLRTRMRDQGDLVAVAKAAVLSTTPKLVRRLRYIPAAGMAAVLLGAAGSAGAASQHATAAGPLAATLAPLALALAVAVPLLVLHAFLANQIDAILAQVSEFAHRLVNALLDRPDVRLGHR
jgi:hypothetical protein